MNSVNQDKIQKWYGYQRYYLPSNRYITIGSNKKQHYYYLWLDIYRDSPQWIDTIPETVMGIPFYCYISECIYCQICLW